MPKFGELPSEESADPAGTESASKKIAMDAVLAMVQRAVPQELRKVDDEGLEIRRKTLAGLPYLPGNDLRGVLDYAGKDGGLLMVKTEEIVGSVSPAFRDWSTEYEGRKGRIAAVAKALIHPTEDSLERVFHLGKPNEQIKLKKVSGPGGDMFFADDGTHRVAGAKLAKTPEIPAHVEDMSELREVRTTDAVLRDEWEARIEKHLIQGRVETSVTGKNSPVYTLFIHRQVLPWMHLPQSKLVKVSKFYEQQYPDSLGKLGVPKEIFTNSVAMNYYLAGRWNEYEKDVLQRD